MEPKTKMEYTFDKWSDVLWREGPSGYVAYCPKHKNRLEILTRVRGFVPQNTVIDTNQVALCCPVDVSASS
jgi:hypothetical protein